MGSRKVRLSSKAALPFKTGNKFKRQDLFAKQKKARENETRDERMRRKREEEKDPQLKEERRRRNIPLTLDRKRVWDDIVDQDVEDGLGVSVDVERLKRQRLEEEAELNKPLPGADADGSLGEDEDHDSMIDSDSDSGDDAAEDKPRPRKGLRTATERATSPTQSTTSTNLNLTPEALAAKFPSLFSETTIEPKILVTTSLNSTLHHEAQLLTNLLPNSVYIRRSAHRYGHKYSVKEISSFAANRNYTAVVVLMEDQKRPSGLDIMHLPVGPHFHFSKRMPWEMTTFVPADRIQAMTNWVEGKRIPGHGNSTGHDPELILNGFRTPLGLLTAHMFKTLFPPKPQIVGRQVVTLHNQRDYIFVRRHRYVFREKKTTEKAVVGADGKEIVGAEGLRTGLQEIGPRFTLKLRRIDKAIQRSSGQEWEWSGKMEKVRTKFQL